MYIVSFCLVSFSKVNIYGCLLTTKHKKASLFSLTLKAPHKSKWVSFGMLDECRQCVCFFSLFSFVKFAQVVIFSIFSQIGGYSNNGTKYLIFNIFHILGNVTNKLWFFSFFSFLAFFSLNSKFETKVFFFQNMFHKMVKIGPSKNHLVQVTELLIFSKKLGFS